MPQLQRDYLVKIGQTQANNQKVFSKMYCRNYRYILTFLCLFTFIAFSEAQENLPFDVTMSVEDKYVIGEIVKLRITIQSVESKENLSLEFREDFFQHFKRKLEVTNPEGSILTSKSESYYRVSQPMKWLGFSNKSPFIFEVELNSDVFPASYGIKKAHKLDVLGRYSIAYESNILVRDKKSGNILWNIPVSLGPKFFDLVEPNINDFKNFENEDFSLYTDEDINSLLNKAVFLDIKEQIFIYTEILNGINTSHKILALEKLGEIKAITAFETLKSYLEVESDPLLRSIAINSISNYQSPEALKIIIDEAASKRERSYRAAVVILAKIGDLSAISILRDIAETDSEDWVKDRAQESIRQILERVNDSNKAAGS